MFLPEAVNQNKIAEDRRKAAFRNIEKWSLELMPEQIRNDAIVSAQEVECMDPDCSPIDTAVNIIFQSGLDGNLDLPMYAHEVTKEELALKFPTKDVLEKWYKGIDAEWPPFDDGGLNLPQLRFDLGTRVMARIGPNAEKDWAKGTVSQLWYAEKSWPDGSFAPYKVKLDDGRQIFAPADMDQVIRKIYE